MLYDLNDLDDEGPFEPWWQAPLCALLIVLTFAGLASLILWATCA